MLLAAVILTILSIGNRRIAQAIEIDLSQFHWKNRLLFLFAPNRSHPIFNTLHKSFAAQKEAVEDRDLVIFEVLESGPSIMNTDILDSQTAQYLRKKLDVPRGEFTVVLIGKDGGIKLKRQGKIKLEDIFALIDSMPMRQEEMRQKAH